MRYITNLILFSILFLQLTPVHAQDIRYRVEILVLTHLNHVEVPAESDSISDYSSAIDFLTPVKEDEEEPEQEQEPVVAAGELAGETVEEEPEIDPNAVLHMEEMSDVMREAWRRLRLSAPFRPQQYLSWEQGNQEPFPVLRVHDLEVIRSSNPDAVEWLQLIEADLMESESEKLELLAAQARAEEPETLVESADEEVEEPETHGLTHYYRLDGTAKLRRSRFLHLELDIQLRQGIWEPEPLAIVSLDPIMYEHAGPTLFEVHELIQSRQVKTDRMEYFDGPVLSVLAYITSEKVESEPSP